MLQALTSNGCHVFPSLSARAVPMQQKMELCVMTFNRNTVAMFTTARGQTRTFYFPPANCLISCCRWRAQRTIGEGKRPTLAQGRVCPHSVHLKPCDGFRLAPLWSFVEIPNDGIWRCLSTLPFLSSPFFFFFPIRRLKLFLTLFQGLFVLLPSQG